MTADDLWKFINDLDDELLRGGVILSEWCSFLVKETDYAFVGGAHLATIITAMAGVETYLRSEYGDTLRCGLSELIDRSSIDDNLKSDLHRLRKYRNRWVHVSDPWDDQELLDHPHRYEVELESMSRIAIRALRRTIYENPWV